MTEENPFQKKTLILMRKEWIENMFSHFRHPLCLYRFLKSLFSGEKFPQGHEYYLVEDDNLPENIEIIKCSTCNHASIGWYKDNDE